MRALWRINFFSCRPSVQIDEISNDSISRMLLSVTAECSRQNADIRCNKSHSGHRAVHCSKKKASQCYTAVIFLPYTAEQWARLSV